MSHTTKADGGTTFIHNGDYSGDVTIVQADEYSPRPEVTIPFEDLRELVFGYLRARMIDAIEHAPDDTIEQAFLGGAWATGQPWTGR